MWAIWAFIKISSFRTADNFLKVRTDKNRQTLRSHQECWRKLILGKLISHGKRNASCPFFRTFHSSSIYMTYVYNRQSWKRAYAYYSSTVYCFLKIRLVQNKEQFNARNTFLVVKCPMLDKENINRKTNINIECYVMPLFPLSILYWFMSSPFISDGMSKYH